MTNFFLRTEFDDQEFFLRFDGEQFNLVTKKEQALKCLGGNPAVKMLRAVQEHKDLKILNWEIVPEESATIYAPETVSYVPE